ncbi:MAG: hypothetical protein IT376_07960 [Polyangiaceae bacterium]|nr:hypothetical protein [Polyangiaceae bacterium]
MSQVNHALVVAGALLLAACGGGAAAGAGTDTTPVGKAGKGADKTTSGQVVRAEAKAGYEAALGDFTQRDKAGDWSEATCKSVGDAFVAAAKSQGKFPEAHYNAGLAYARCDKDADARAQFEAAAKADPGFHRARAQLVLYDHAKTPDLDATIRKLDQIIRDAKFQNVEALVSLAALQMERGNDVADGEGKNDFERAQRNLQRALAIDDSYMPAFNQLAIYYLEQARAASEKDKDKATKKQRRRTLVVAGAKKTQVNNQMLDLAALVAGQAVRKNPNYAPIHNTAGLIQVELRNFNGAVKSFAAARRLDTKFFEAHMNYAAVNISFRGFAEAEKAYRDALKLRPNEFEAHLGLALAIRGQIDDSNFDKYVAEAQKHLDLAKKADPSRAEPYYNEAILTQEYKAKSVSGETGAAKTIPILEAAAGLYRQFISKAGADPVFADAVKRSKERAQDIEDMIKFLKAGEEDRKRMEEEEKQRAATQSSAPDADQPGTGGGQPPAGGDGATPPPADAPK